MPLAKRFKLGLSSCFGGGIPPPAEKEEETKTASKPYDFTQHREHATWSLAVAAAATTKNKPTPEDALVPWSHTIPAASDGGASEVCTFTPLSGAGRATLFLRTTLTASALASRLNKDFFEDELIVKDAGEENGNEKNKPDESSGKTPVDDTPALAPNASLVPARGGTPALVIEASPGSYMYGPVLALTSTMIDAQEMLEYLESIFHTGYACILPHDAMTTNMRTKKGNMRLTTRTGVHQEDKKGAPSSKSLATIFELEFDRAPKFNSPDGHKPHGLGDNVVARAVIAYRDTSGWPSVGPTIQSIEVRRDYHGSGLVQDLFNAVEMWFVKFWTLDTAHHSRCLKATQLQDTVVDRTPLEDGADPLEEYHVLTDKKFLYEVMLFRINFPNPMDPLGQLGTDVRPETHAIKQYPGTGSVVRLPTVANSTLMAQGWRSCDNCRTPEEDLDATLLVCGDCTLPIYWRAHYCSHDCQREDWSIHKLCCGKSYDEVCAGKEALEESILADVAASTAAAVAPSSTTTTRLSQR